MKRISILMCANRLKSVLVLLVAICGPVVVLATDEPVGDPHRVVGNHEFQETIEGRCTPCHNRDLVDQAQGQGEDLQSLLQRMIERGAVVNERDRSVLGTFWGSPTGSDKPSR